MTTMTNARSRFLGNPSPPDSYEAKYALVGNWLRQRTPERTVAISALHSGSIRYYASRDIVRWGGIPPGMLVPSVKRLSADGYRTYVVLYTGEVETFNERFSRELPAWA